MKALNVFFGAQVDAASLVASPAVLGSLLATVAGLLLMASPALPGIAQAMPAQAPAPVVQVVRVAADPLRIFPLDDGAGVVVFRNVDGKLVNSTARGSGSNGTANSLKAVRKNEGLTELARLPWVVDKNPSMRHEKHVSTIKVRKCSVMTSFKNLNCSRVVTTI